MVPGIDRGGRARARMGVESIFGQVRYKKREAIASLKYTLGSDVDLFNVTMLQGTMQH